MTEQPHAPFVAFLTSLVPRNVAGAEPHKGDRAALATLRRGLGKPLGQAIVAMAPLVERWVPVEARQSERAAYYMVAALFASNPRHRPAYSFARAFRSFQDERDSSSLERRFQALLDAEGEDLGVHLRHLTALMAQDERGFDWGALLADCQRWSHPDRYVQSRWAREFWGPLVKTEDEPQAASN